MDHVFYLDGNTKRVSWIIQTDNSISKQNREHADIYKDKISNLQSKYVALHIGLFWGIGAFKIKNEGSVRIKLDDEVMYKQLTTSMIIKDEFVKNRIKFINQLIAQRKLKIQYERIESKNNLADKILDARELETKDD